MLIPKKTHNLKILPEYFAAVVSGEKRFELRKNDRDFREGDYLRLREWYKGQYSGNQCKVRIEYILHSGDVAGLKDGYCIMSIGPIEAGCTTHMLFADESFEGG